MLKAIVIDDELYAREELTALLKETAEVAVIASCTNAIEGLQQVNSLKPDVVFLDIQMPKITGLEMLSMLDPETMPYIVFVTAYDEYALKAFEDNAFDYILKPIETVRLHKTIKHLKSSLKKSDYTPLLQEQLELIPCTGYNRFIFRKPDEIAFAYSDHTGVHLMCTETAKGERKNNCALSLKVLEKKTTLIRCHRQYLVNPAVIREIKLLENSRAEIITNDGVVVPISRRYLKVLKERFSLS
jgi:two-component system LytT family response regulator